MHIPDNFLSPPVWASLDAVAIPAIAIVSRQAQKSTDTNRLPLLGVMGAFVFAAQMINFPVGIGTSGHLVGGTLLACLLGPWAAALVMAAILIVQALVFQDGGVLALGANVVNMALIGVLAGYLPARTFFISRWKFYGVFLGATSSVLVSGVLALSELACSGIRMPPHLIGLSLGLFAVNALIEGGITVVALRAIERIHPNLTNTFLTSRPIHRNYDWRRISPAIAASSIVLVALGILLTSTAPDGLEHLGQWIGLRFGAHPLFHSPLSDYQVHALGASWFSRAAAGLLGLLFVFFVCIVGGHLLTRTRRSYS